MRIVEPPSLDSPWRGRHGDLDGLLSDFFRSELPKPWPEPPIANEQPKTLPARKLSSRWSAVRSRLALAASIALLLAGGWFLSGKFEDVSGSGGSYMNEGADTRGGHFKREKNLKEDGPPIRHRIFVDPSGQAGLQFDVDLP